MPDCPRPRLRLKHQGQPDAFGDVSAHLLTWMRICLDNWANVLSTGAREAAWAVYEWTTACGQEEGPAVPPGPFLNFEGARELIPL